MDMSIAPQFHECLTAAENSLAVNESIVQFRLAQPNASKIGVQSMVAMDRANVFH